MNLDELGIENESVLNAMGLLELLYLEIWARALCNNRCDAGLCDRKTMNGLNAK
jgi:hypothetical protein